MFAQRSPIIIIQNIISAVFGYIGLFFILRYIGTADWGFVGAGIGFVGVLSLFSDLGYSTAHTIKISEGEDLGVCNGTFLAVKLVLGFLFVVLTLAFLFVWTNVLHKGFQSPIEYWIIISLIPYFFFQNFIGFTNTYFRATMKSMRTSIPPLIEAILRNSIFIMLAFIIRFSTSSSPDYMAALYISATYSFTFAVYFFVSLYIGRPWKISRPTSSMLKTYTLLALPLVLVTSVGTINGNIDKVVIQFFWEANATSAFFSSQQISAVVTTLAGSLSMFFLPLLIRRGKHAGKEEHNRSIYDFENIISLYILPFVIIMIVLATYVMNIFNQAYIVYSGMLSLLAFRAYLSAINSPYVSAIASRSKTGTIAKIDTSMVFLNILLIALLVPPNIFGFSYFSLGWIGAPVAMVVATFVSTVIYRVVVARVESVKVNLYILRHIVPAGAQVLFILLVIHFVTPKDILILAPLSLLSLGIYFLVAIGMKETSFDTLLGIIRNFNPKRLSSRYREESQETETDLVDMEKPKKDY